MKTYKLKYNPNNPRRIAPAQLDRLKKSIKEFPEMMELRPMVYDPATMQVLGGNQRLAAIKSLDMTDIPDTWAIPADKLTDKQKKEFILKDNIPLGEWDFAVLESDFAEFELGEIGIELPDVFADAAEIGEVDAAPQIDKASELQEKWQTSLGQIWICGRHRVMCGDSTVKDDVDALMNGHNANLLVTSPPYWNQREYSHWQHFSAYIDDMRKTIDSAALDTNAIVFWNIGDDSANHQHISAKHSVMLEESGLVYIDAIVWKKQGMTGIRLAHQKTHNKYYPAFSFEMCLVYQKDNTDFPSFDDKYKDTIPISNVWDMCTANNKGKLHSAPFPVELPTNAIMCYTNKCAINVYDPFIGSGTTLIACENTNRTCYGMEIDPGYVGVILQRYYDATGNNPELVNG